MLTTRRVCSLLAVLVLVLGMANTAVYAGTMVGSALAIAADSMDEGGCADCSADNDMAICVTVVCPFFAALLPDMATMPAAELLQRAPPYHQSGSGLNPFPDTGPPRDIALG